MARQMEKELSIIDIAKQMNIEPEFIQNAIMLYQEKSIKHILKNSEKHPFQFSDGLKVNIWEVSDKMENTQFLWETVAISLGKMISERLVYKPHSIPHFEDRK